MRGRESQARTTAWSSTHPHTHTPPHQQIHLILPHGLPGRSRGQGQGAYAVETHAAPAKETAMRGGEVATHISVRSSLSHPSPWSPPGAGVFARWSPTGLLTRVAPGTIARATGCACVRLLNSNRISGSVHTACWIVTKPRKERKTEHPHRVRLSSKPKEIGKETSTGTPPRPRGIDRDNGGQPASHEGQPTVILPPVLVECRGFSTLPSTLACLWAESVVDPRLTLSRQGACQAHEGS